MKTLVVSYTPRGERSHTKRVLDEFLQALPGSHQVELFDLCHNVPDMFIVDNLLAYIDRNYLGLDLAANREELLEKSDMMCSKLMEAEQLVWAFPMHNFSLPSIVKAWVDAVTQKGKVFDYAESGYKGLLGIKRAAIIMASGGIYEGEMASLNHASTHAEAVLKFMGVGDISVIHAAGMNLQDGKAEVRLSEAVSQAKSLAAKWA